MLIYSWESGHPLTKMIRIVFGPSGRVESRFACSDAIPKGKPHFPGIALRQTTGASRPECDK
ncbi:hypothetical protein X739_02980 [Mesorhizobium sp. LNHC220B00]|nr:hypothetical protein X739_02980 [Mesorhizobium sp. LNHC220B00]